MTCTGSPRYRLSVLPAAASPLSRDLWSGPRRSAALLADLQEVVYLGLDGDVLPVERAGGIGLPTAVRVAGRLPPVAGLVEVGDGAIRLGGQVVRVVREWRPARVTPVVGLDLDPAYVARRLEVVGRGPGLTPESDDVLCGVLLVANAVGAAYEVAPRLATTDLSASLIRAAAQGYAVREVVRLVDAALAGRATPDLTAAVRRLGHSSGPALVAGIEAAISHTTSRGGLSA